MNFSVEEENLICMYHTSDRRRTMARMLAALPDMDTEIAGHGGLVAAVSGYFSCISLYLFSRWDFPAVRRHLLQCPLQAAGSQTHSFL